MEHPFFPMTTTRAEALRWLSIAEKLLSARDLVGSKSFATRARDADPTLSPADQILAVTDTILAGDMRIGNNLQDLYAILRLTPQQGRDAELIARQYRSLALILNPQKNNFPFAEHAFALVLEAWSVLSNPSRKMLYDKELAFYLQSQQPHQTDLFGNPIPSMHHNIFAGASSSSGVTYPSQPQGVTYPPQPQGVTYPPQPQSTAHFSQVQVHTNSPVQPAVVEESVRVPQNPMSFTSGSNIVFGTGLGSKTGNESVNKQAQGSYSGFEGNVAAPAPTTSQGQVSNNNVRTAGTSHGLVSNKNVAPAAGTSHGQVNNKNVAAAGTSQGQVSNNHEQPQQNYSNLDEGTSHNVNVNDDVDEMMEDEEDVERVVDEEAEDTPAPYADETFWTACPYCYYMYQYPSMYIDCTLRCSNCKMGFQAVIIPNPPPVVDGQEGYFCCWGFIPLGFSMENWEKNKASASSWTPFSPMFSCPQVGNAFQSTKPGRKNTEPRIYVDDDEVFVEFSDSSDSDDDWSNNKQKQKKKATNFRGKGTSGAPTRSAKRAQIDKGKDVDVQNELASQDVLETPSNTAADVSNKGPAASARKQPARAAKNFGKLDLNVECSNEAEEPALRVNEENGPSHGGDDNIEGIGFFEGLDEFLSSLPILNPVGDERVVKAA
ncbi:uncharacterized protein LOC127260424 [Andrographis paniculata]|uniref:uncharacterized protein LOC127260424 n=1 Tax=Andrographis paniculata TaxID=175694 RepID=UPI0021E868BB|nr:uncharacterized protein LOC127260424 [Andrographis paniculata]